MTVVVLIIMMITTTTKMIVVSRRVEIPAMFAGAHGTSRPVTASILPFPSRGVVLSLSDNSLCCHCPKLSLSRLSQATILIPVSLFLSLRLSLSHTLFISRFRCRSLLLSPSLLFFLTFSPFRTSFLVSLQ